MTLKSIAGLAALVILSYAAQAAAQTNSAYTDLNLDQCTIMHSDDFGSSWACPGYKGYPLYVAEGDLRFFVSYGFGAPEEVAATQTPPPFNTLGPRVEWRLGNETGVWKPFATIVRYHTSLGYGEKEAQVLVVTRLEPGATCQVAYIDATANSDANELAREAADTLAPGFDCATDEPTFSEDFSAWEL